MEQKLSHRQSDGVRNKSEKAQESHGRAGLRI